jgi:NAD(P) transhydrogenase subunit beta
VSFLDVVTLLYLVASVCFIQALKGLSHPTTSIRGNLFGMVGMAIAVATTAALIVHHAGSGLGLAWVLVGLVVGGGYGAYRARTVEMTKMPELVAFFHSMIGLAAVFIAVAAVAEPQAFGITTADGPIPGGNRIELALGAFIGAVTFSGSVIAFGKLSGTYKFRLFQGAPVVFKGQHLLNAVLGLAALFFLFGFWQSQSAFDFAMVCLLGFILGVTIIIPIGGADMPVVVSMLNSYSGWAAAGIGFSLNNSMLIIAGSLVGSSGAILSYIMCKAMNRSFFNVILGGFGGDATAAAGGKAEQRPVKSGSADDAAFVLGNAETVIIVPGYGLAVARAQHAVKELALKLVAKGVTVKYAIHPVAGSHAGPHERAPGRGRGAVRPGVRDGGHQRRVRPGRRRHRPRRQRRREPRRADEGQRHLRHADPGGLQGEDRDRQQALDGGRLRRPRQRAFLHGQDDDGLRRREEGRRGHGQGGRVGAGDHGRVRGRCGRRAASRLRRLRAAGRLPRRPMAVGRDPARAGAGLGRVDRDLRRHLSADAARERASHRGWRNGVRRRVRRAHPGAVALSARADAGDAVGAGGRLVAVNAIAYGGCSHGVVRGASRRPPPRWPSIRHPAGRIDGHDG